MTTVGNPIRRARSPEAFREFLKERPCEIEALRALIEYDQAFMTEALGFVTEFEAGPEAIGRDAE